MTIRANFANRYLMRYMMFAIVCGGFALYCLYDGLVVYPKKLEQSIEFEKLSDLEPNEARAQWLVIAEQKGWSANEPKSIGVAKYDLVMQFVFLGISLAAGIPFLVLFLRSRGSWMETTENGIATSRGQQMEFDQIEVLNKRKWADKGIAKIVYSADGKKQRMVLDDCKFEREPTEQLLRLVESKIDADQITNGAPEPPLDEEQAAASSSDTTQPES